MKRWVVVLEGKDGIPSMLDGSVCLKGWNTWEIGNTIGLIGLVLDDSEMINAEPVGLAAKARDSSSYNLKISRMERSARYWQMFCSSGKIQDLYRKKLLMLRVLSP